MTKILKQADLAVRYRRAAQLLRDQARVCDGAKAAELLRKADAYTHNVERLTKWAIDRDLVKGFPIKRRIKWKGLDIAIEQPAGSCRKWKDDFTGDKGETWMLYDYGYINRSKGADKEQVDVYVGPYLDDAEMVYVVRQMRSPGFSTYDEDKCMVGFPSEEAAAAAYRAHYDNPGFLGQIDSFPVDTFIDAVKQTRKAPAPIGGWLQLMVPQAMYDHPLLPKEVSGMFVPPDETTEPARWHQGNYLTPEAEVEWNAMGLGAPAQINEVVCVSDGNISNDLLQLGFGQSLRKGESKYGHINFTPPEGVASAAARGLQYRKKASPSNKGGLTPGQAAKEGQLTAAPICPKVSL